MGATFPIKVPITAIDRFSKVLGKMGGNVARWGQRITSAGRTLTLGLTVPTIALGVASARTGITFQRSLNRVAATTGATDEELQALRHTAEELAGQTHSLTETGQAMELLALKGEDLLSIQRQTPSVLHLATIANVDLAEAVELTTDSLELYGLGAESAVRMTDLLAAASQKTDLGNLLEAMRVAAPRARATGQSLGQLVSILDVLADEGFEGAQGGAAVEAMLRSLVTPGAQAIKVFRDLDIQGRDLFTPEGKLRDLAEVLELLGEKGATPNQVLRIFSRTGGPAAAAILEKKLIPAIRSGALELENVDGRAQDLVNTLTGGGVDSATRLATAWEKVGLALAESGVLDALADGVRLVGVLVAKFQALDPATKRFIVNAGLVGAVVGPALVFFGQLTTTVSGLAGAFKLLGAAGFGKGVGGLLLKVAPWAALAVAIGSITMDVLDLIDAIRGTNSEAFGGGVDRPAVDAGQFAHLGRSVAGEPLGAQRLEAMDNAGAQAARAEVGGRIQVDVKAPRGTRVRAEGRGDVDFDVFTGVNLAGAL